MAPTHAFPAKFRYLVPHMSSHRQLSFFNVSVLLSDMAAALGKCSRVVASSYAIHAPCSYYRVNGLIAETSSK